MQVQNLALSCEIKVGDNICFKVYVHKMKANPLLGRNTAFPGTETQEKFLFSVSTNRSL